MKTQKTILALGAFFVAAALALAGCGSSAAVPDGSVAVVAGNPISTQAFNHWMYVAAKGQAASSPNQPVIVPNDPPTFAKCVAQVRRQIPRLKTTPDTTLKADCKQLFTSLSGQVLDFLIKAYWFQADAHRLGIKVTDAQVQTALTNAKKQQFQTDAQYQTFLTRSGQTTQDILFRVRVNEIYQKLTARHPVAVTPAAIAAYYASHKAQFGTPESRDLRIVLTKTASQASAARAALQHGKSFVAVAKKYSIDPTTKNSGGLLTGVTAGQQDAALSKASFSAPVNKLQGPIKGQFGYYVLQVTKIVPATQRTLAQSEALIKQTLTSQLQTTAQGVVDSHAKSDWQRRTKCRATYAMADCNGYKAPKTPTGVPGGAGPPPGSGGPPPSSGGAPPSSGGAPPSSGGAPPSSGGSGSPAP